MRAEKLVKNLTLKVFLCVSLLLILTPQAFSKENSKGIDHSLFNSLLEKFVTEKGFVRYKALMQDKEQLDKYVEKLREVSMADASRAEKQTFYINAYNACTLQLILRHYSDIESIKDIGGSFDSPFKGPEWELAGETLTLNQIENKKLREGIGDARIHFAINCASISCPPLRQTAYKAEKIDKQLDEVTRAFIRKNVMHKTEDSFWGGQKYLLSVSKIFKWYEKDYKPSVPAFIARYATEDTKQFIQEHQDDIRLDYQNYDWRLNEAGKMTE